MSILNDKEVDFFNQNGYLVIKDVIPKENIINAVDAIWNFLEMNPNNPETWYTGIPSNNGIREIYHDQALWNNRQHPKIYKIFSELLDNKYLWVSIDRSNMKAPSHPDHPKYDDAGMLHFDVDVRKPHLPVTIQGSLALTDTFRNSGGFHCVPGFHRKAHQWANNLPFYHSLPFYQRYRNYRTNLTKIDPEAFANIQPVECEAGDLIVWNGGLPHGNGRNTSNKPRLAQYIAMSPALEDNEELRENRVRCWRNNTPPFFNATRKSFFSGTHCGKEQQQARAELTDLGKRLLGLKRWCDA